MFPAAVRVCVQADYTECLTQLLGYLEAVMRFSEAVMVAEELVALLRPPGDSKRLVEALVMLAEALYRSGREDDALVTAEDAVAMSRRLEDDEMLYLALSRVAGRYSDVKRLKDAEAALLEATSVCDRMHEGADHRDMVVVQQALAGDDRAHNPCSRLSSCHDLAHTHARSRPHLDGVAPRVALACVRVSFVARVGLA